jgi:hypothetical protein
MRNAVRTLFSTVRRRTRKLIAGLGLVLCISLLGAVVFVWSSTGCRFPDTPKYQAETGARIWRTAAQLWVEEAGAQICPTSAELRSARSVDPEQSELDPWGVAFRIECDGDHIAVRSAGPDRSWRTPDDVTSPRSRSDP